MMPTRHQATTLVNVSNVDIINVVNVDTINTALLHGEVDRKGVFPHLDTLEFAWFGRTFPKGHLTVVSASRFEAERMTGVTMEDFLEQK